MNTGLTAKHISAETNIPVGKIRHWAKQGHFNHLGYRRKRAFYFHNLEDAAAAARELAKKEEVVEAPEEIEEQDIFSRIDTETSQGIEDIRRREELKSLVIKNRKHAEQYILIADYENNLRTLALEVRTHMEGMATRLVTVINRPDLDKEIYDFCVAELENLHGKISKLVH